MNKLFLAFLFLASSACADAGRLSGHPTTFDPNSYGGGWTCFRTAASGACGSGSFAQFFDATCDGSASDDAAMAAWLTYAVAQGNALTKLYIPSGSRCKFSSGTAGNPLWDGTLGGAGVKRAIIWAYGASATNFSFSGETFYQNNTHSSRINTANPGDTTVTLITGSEISRYAVGNWICINALELQTSGFPPNWQYFEYRKIIAINGSTITLNDKLTKTYKSTYPLVNAGGAGATDLAGPASIHLMNPSWDTDSVLYGLTVFGPNGVNSAGRNIAHYDVNFRGLGSAPTASIQLGYYFSYLGEQIEVDKVTAFMTLYGVTTQQILMQSASIDFMTIDRSAAFELIGTTSNTRIVNSTFTNKSWIAPTSFGHGNTLTILNSSVFNGAQVPQSINTALLSFAGGTFSIAIASGSVDQFYEWAVPNQKYFFAFYDGSIHTCTPSTVFTITDVTQDATNNNAVTDIVGALPTPTCGGNPPNRYFAYPAATITQTNSGPSDLSQFAAPP